MTNLSTYYTYESMDKDGRPFCSGGWYEAIGEASEHAKKDLHCLGDYSYVSKITGPKVTNKKRLVRNKLTTGGVITVSV